MSIWVESFGVGKKGRNFLRSGKITYGEPIKIILKCLSFGPSEEGRKVLMKKMKMARDSPCMPVL